MEIPKSGKRCFLYFEAPCDLPSLWRVQYSSLIVLSQFHYSRWILFTSLIWDRWLCFIKLPCMRSVRNQSLFTMTHWPREKMVEILQANFPICFLKETFLYFYSNFVGVCSHEFRWQSVSQYWFKYWRSFNCSQLPEPVMTQLTDVSTIT